MTRYESKITTATVGEEALFNTLSDLNNLSKFIDKIPENNQVKNIKCETDSVRVTVNPVGEIGMRIIERIPSSTIKFTSEKSPVSFTMWIQLKQITENDTKIKITLDADLNIFLKGMVGNYLQNFVDTLAGQLAAINFS